MHFLMAKFKRILDQYKYHFTLVRNKNNTYTLKMYNLPPELDYKMTHLTFDEIVEVLEPIEGERKKIQVARCEKRNICTPERIKRQNIIVVEFNEDDYAVKINKIETMFRTSSLGKVKNFL